MTGLLPGWETLKTIRFSIAASSASGAYREETLTGIPLLSALAQQDFTALRIRSEDGSGLLLSREDAAAALLVPTANGWKLVLPQDQTRRRWLKRPAEFIFYP